MFAALENAAAVSWLYFPFTDNDADIEVLDCCWWRRCGSRFLQTFISLLAAVLLASIGTDSHCVCMSRALMERVSVHAVSSSFCFMRRSPAASTNSERTINFVNVESQRASLKEAAGRRSAARPSPSRSQSPAAGGRTSSTEPHDSSINCWCCPCTSGQISLVRFTPVPVLCVNERRGGLCRPLCSSVWAGLKAAVDQPHYTQNVLNGFKDICAARFIQAGFMFLLWRSHRTANHIKQQSETNQWKEVIYLTCELCWFWFFCSFNFLFVCTFSILTNNKLTLSLRQQWPPAVICTDQCVCCLAYKQGLHNARLQQLRVNDDTKKTLKNLIFPSGPHHDTLLFKSTHRSV